MATLAIKGHPKRGNEVIEILEMLGGRNLSLLFGDSALYYAIDREGIISTHCEEQVIQFYLEEFLEKFPYKVGDKIVYKTYGIHSKIKSMLWNVEKEQVFYRLESNKLFVATSDELKPLKEETMEEGDKAMALNLVGEDYSGKRFGYKIPQGYEFDCIQNNEIIIKPIKPQYPKTYVECAKILDCFSATHIDGYKCELLEKLQELIICRDAYWKIAGEQMGLDKPWEPDWENCCATKYTISCVNNKIKLFKAHEYNYILAFSTEEMRNKFYENFKDLIEQCKELL